MQPREDNYLKKSNEGKIKENKDYTKGCREDDYLKDKQKTNSGEHYTTIIENIIEEEIEKINYSNKK